MTALLVEIAAVTGAGTSYVRMASVDEPEVCALNNVEWTPAAVSLSGLSFNIFDPDFQNRATGATGYLTFDANRVQVSPSIAPQSWASKPVTIYIGQVGDPWSSYTTLFKGVIGSMGFDATGLGQATLQSDTTWLETSILTTYAGTGGAEGPANLKGTVKPFALGSPVSIAPVAIDASNLVYQFHGYGSVQAVDVVWDGAARLTFSADYASYSALVAATVPRGKYATCLAAGMVRLGTSPTYPMTLSVRGDNSTSAGFIQKTGAAITRIAGLASAPSGSLDTTSLSALDTAVTGTISHYLTSQTSAGDLIDDLVGPCNAAAVVGLSGQLYVTRAALGIANLFYATDGGETGAFSGFTDGGPCGRLTYRNLPVPYWKLAATAAKTYRVLGPGEIAYYAELNDRGAWSSSTTYREGDQVTGPDLARYQYTSTTPTSGNALSNATYWTLIAAAPHVSDISGAGALAGQNTVTWGSQVTGTGKPADNATVGATWGVNISGQPSNSLLLNSSQSFSLGSNGALYWNDGSSGSTLVGQANLSAMGAGAMALLNGLNSGNITTYIGAQAIPGALIGLAAIGTANIANAAITSAQIDDLSLSSFSSGSSGWKIWKNGNAEFNGVVLSRDQRVADSYYYPSWYTSGAGDNTWRTYFDDWIDTGVSPSVWDYRGPMVPNARLNPGAVYQWDDGSGTFPLTPVYTCEVTGMRDYVNLKGASTVHIRVRVDGYNVNMGTAIYFTVFRVT